MRDLNELNRFRLKSNEVIKMWGWTGDGTCGAFILPSPIDSKPLQCIASSGHGWDHVSVNRQKRCPNWPEMSFIYKKFFKDNERAFQLHVPDPDHVNIANFCLHLWRPHEQAIPLPPIEFV